MRYTSSFLYHLVVCIITLFRPAGVKSVAAENLILRQQLIVIGRAGKRSPSLNQTDRTVFALLAQIIPRTRLRKLAIIVQPATTLKSNRAMIRQKYRALYSAKSPGKPGPKGPDQDLIRLVLDIEHRNPRMDHDRVAMQALQALFLDQKLFSNAADLSKKLAQYKIYYHEFRSHRSLGGKTPVQIAEKACVPKQPIRNWSWISHCNGQFNTPIACSIKNSHGRW